MKYMTLLAAFLVSACASQGPIIDKGQGFNEASYAKDYQECKAYQEQVKNQTGKSALSGAIVGGLIGAITGDAKDSAALGAIAGGTKGVGSTSQSKKQVLYNCLSGRGYRILN